MNRRGFLQSILALGAAPAIVKASSLMRVSGIIIPSTEEVLEYNGLLTPSIITREALKIIQQNLIMANRVNRKFESQFVKIGSTLTIQKPSLVLP